MVKLLSNTIGLIFSKYSKGGEGHGKEGVKELNDLSFGLFPQLIAHFDSQEFLFVCFYFLALTLLCLSHYASPSLHIHPLLLQLPPKIKFKRKKKEKKKDQFSYGSCSMTQ